MFKAAIVRDADQTDDSPIKAALRAAPLLHELDDRLLDRLAAITTVVSIQAGGEVCRQAEVNDALYIVLEGQVAASSAGGSGTAAVVEVVRPGEAIGLATLLARMPRMVTARAIGPCRLLSIEAKGLLALVEREAALVNAFLCAQARSFQALIRQVRDLKLLTTAQRLACFLLSLVPHHTSNTASLRLPFDKRLLAARLGCRQENLSRAFAALRTLGVETHGARVILHDIARLHAYALPDDPA